MFACNERLFATSTNYLLRFIVNSLTFSYNLYIMKLENILPKLYYEVSPMKQFVGSR